MQRRAQTMNFRRRALIFQDGHLPTSLPRPNLGLSWLLEHSVRQDDLEQCANDGPCVEINVYRWHARIDMAAYFSLSLASFFCKLQMSPPSFRRRTKRTHTAHNRCSSGSVILFSPSFSFFSLSLSLFFFCFTHSFFFLHSILRPFVTYTFSTGLIECLHVCVYITHNIIKSKSRESFVFLFLYLFPFFLSHRFVSKSKSRADVKGARWGVCTQIWQTADAGKLYLRVRKRREETMASTHTHVYKWRSLFDWLWHARMHS